MRRQASQGRREAGCKRCVIRIYGLVITTRLIDSELDDQVINLARVFKLT